jgi:uncharacterized protein (DUF885 family)
MRLALAVVLVVSVPRLTAAAPPAGPDAALAARVTALADEFVREYYDRYPLDGTADDVPGTHHDRLRDNTLAATQRWDARVNALAAEVARADPARLWGQPAWVTHGVMQGLLEYERAYGACRFELWGVRQMFGWQEELDLALDVQPVGTAERRRQLLARLAAVPRFVDTEIANLREGLRRGFRASRVNVQLVIVQMDVLLKGPPEQSIFFGPARRDGDAAFARASVGLITRGIRPALARYRDFLRRDYLPVARAGIGVGELPSGRRCYEGAVRGNTGLPLAPEAVHRLGLEQMAKIEAEMKVIARRSFGTDDFRRVLDRVRTERKYLYASRPDVLDTARTAVARAEAAMPRWFGIVPRARVTVEQCPPYRDVGEDARYNSASDDGQRPATIQLATVNAERRSRIAGESVAFHEGVPGHHLQIAIGRERGAAVHPLARYTWNVGFGEGWALYAEQLADEMGLFSSDVARLGMLSERALRATRLVVDPGIHVLGWSRERAVQYMVDHTALSRDGAEVEIDRYAVMPGQATAYLVGMLEILRLRADARRALGPRFDIRQFHDRVLENGKVTLPMLRATIARWIQAQRR